MPYKLKGSCPQQIKLQLKKYEEHWGRQAFEIKLSGLPVYKSQQKLPAPTIRPMFQIEVYENMTQWDTWCLLTYKNSNRNNEILRCISGISFSNLSKLQLIDINLRNIQALSWMEMLKVNHIRIYNNKITSIKSVSKLNLGCIVNIDIVLNPIQLLMFSMERVISRIKTPKVFDTHLPTLFNGKIYSLRDHFDLHLKFIWRAKLIPQKFNEIWQAIKILSVEQQKQIKEQLQKTIEGIANQNI